MQPEMFSQDAYGDITANRHGGSATSREANEDVAPHKARLRDIIVSFVDEQGEHGATVEEIAETLGLRYTTVSGRCAEAKRDGRLMESGRRRPTSTGSAAAVLVAV